MRGSWQLYRVPVSVGVSGDLQLEIIAPSSHAAPAGRIWIDDVALYETKMPPLLNLTRSRGFHDEPAMALAEDGSLYIAFNRFIEDADSLQIARLRSVASGWEVVGEWQVAGGQGTYILGVNAVAAGDRVAVTYAIERNRDWNIQCVYCGPDGPDNPLVISDAVGVDAKPDAAWHGGTLWVAWESNRNGYREILVASARGTTVSEPVALSSAGVSSYDPSIAVLSNGQVCVAWHAFDENNYDIFLCRSGSGGDWTSGLRLTRCAVDRSSRFAAGSRRRTLVAV